MTGKKLLEDIFLCKIKGHPNKNEPVTYSELAGESATVTWGFGRGSAAAEGQESSGAGNRRVQAP